VCPDDAAVVDGDDDDDDASAPSTSPSATATSIRTATGFTSFARSACFGFGVAFWWLLGSVVAFFTRSIAPAAAAAAAAAPARSFGVASEALDWRIASAIC